MCDCYTANCEGCKCNMEIHIADFCTERENVHPYCPRCTRKLKKKWGPQGIPLKIQKIFDDVVDRYGDGCPQVDGGKKGQPVIILCDDPKAYGISLN